VKDHIFELRRKSLLLNDLSCKMFHENSGPFSTIIKKQKSTIYGHFTDPVGNDLAFTSRHATPLKRGASFRDVLLNAP